MSDSNNQQSLQSRRRERFAGGHTRQLIPCDRLVSGLWYLPDILDRLVNSRRRILHHFFVLGFNNSGATLEEICPAAFAATEEYTGLARLTQTAINEVETLFFRFSQEDMYAAPVHTLKCIVIPLMVLERETRRRTEGVSRQLGLWNAQNLNLPALFGVEEVEQLRSALVLWNSWREGWTTSSTLDRLRIARDVISALAEALITRTFNVLRVVAIDLSDVKEVDDAFRICREIFDCHQQILVSNEGIGEMAKAMDKEYNAGCCMFDRMRARENTLARRSPLCYVERPLQPGFADVRSASPLISRAEVSNRRADTLALLEGRIPEAPVTTPRPPFEQWSQEQARLMEEQANERESIITPRASEQSPRSNFF